ncbi:MAG: hypothetical protein WBA65_08230 [Rhodanobacter sp.]
MIWKLEKVLSTARNRTPGGHVAALVAGAAGTVIGTRDRSAALIEGVVAICGALPIVMVAT